MNIYEDEKREDEAIETDSYEESPNEEAVEEAAMNYDVNEDIIILQNDFSSTKQETKEVINKDEAGIKNPRKLKTKKSIEYIEDGDYSSKTWSVTLVLCILLGFIGFHRFYVGKAGTAILMLLTLGGFGIWVLVDLIRIIINNFTDEEGKIVKRNSFAS